MNMMMRRTGMLSMAAVSFFLLCGDTAPQTCNPQPVNDHFGRDIALAGVAVGAVVVTSVVLVHNHNAGHRLKGCVTAGPDGLKLVTDDHKTYTLGGDVAGVKEGDMVKIHGSKIKKTKDSTGDQTFTVEKLNKDYGACKIAPAAVPGA